MLPTLLPIRNNSFGTGIFPESEKSGIIFPRIKDSKLDPEAFENYRPVVHESNIEKILEKTMQGGIQKHLTDNNLYPKNQSAYRNFHSTETLLLQVHSSGEY